MFRPQAVLAVVVSLSLFVLPTNGAPASAIGTVTSASGARIGAAPASVGSTIFVGDHLSTEKLGSIQVRAGAARLLLSGASAVDVAQLQGTTPAATLLSGTVVFSTANAKAFVLHASKADIRAKTDEPTVGQITFVNDKELRVRCNRGALAISVEDETQFVPEGMSYRVILDPDSYYAAEASAQGPQGAGSRGGRPPLRAGRSRFLLIAIIIIGVATGVALYEALQSPDHP
ncbi:MAG TPA: hypothetical protein VN749_07055 [Candidatus Eisenbacteria bacterium]|jgi:hypothetical protein|nr:hypothetical protein [Candidatus Eisenbacteria bacterium]